MKLSPREASGFFRKPDPACPGLLIHGADAMRVAIRRAEVIAAMIGPQGEADMRLTRLSGGDLRGDAAPLIDAVKAIGFFPGPRAVLVEDATDMAAPAVEAALEDWRAGDAQIVVTAGALKPTSKLRKLFEGHRQAFAAAIYDDPPGRDEIERMLADAGVQGVGREPMEMLMGLSRAMGPGDLRQMIEKIGLYKLGDAAPLSLADIDACAPATTDADLDQVLDAVADAREAEVGPLLARYQAQGANPVTICIMAGRHFRMLHRLASDPGGPAAGAGRVRPPLFGPRRDRAVRQAQAWGMQRLEDAMGLILDTDLALRSAGQTAPQMALTERMLLRLAHLGMRK